MDSLRRVYFRTSYLYIVEMVETNDIFIAVHSILGRIIRVTDEVIDYRKWIKETFLLPLSEGDSLSSSTGSDASTLSAPASDTVKITLQIRTSSM